MLSRIKLYPALCAKFLAFPERITASLSNYTMIKSYFTFHSGGLNCPILIALANLPAQGTAQSSPIHQRHLEVMQFCRTGTSPRVLKRIYAGNTGQIFGSLSLKRLVKMLVCPFLLPYPVE